jgi:hypothetical protein
VKPLCSINAGWPIIAVFDVLLTAHLITDDDRFRKYADFVVWPFVMADITPPGELLNHLQSPHHLADSLPLLQSLQQLDDDLKANHYALA